MLRILRTQIESCCHCDRGDRPGVVAALATVDLLTEQYHIAGKRADRTSVAYHAGQAIAVIFFAVLGVAGIYLLAALLRALFDLGSAL